MLKKILIFLIFLVTIAIVALLSIIVMGNASKTSQKPTKKINVTGFNMDYVVDSFDEEYEVYLNESLIGSFSNFNEACAVCEQNAGSIVRKKGGDGVIYENIYRYSVIINGEEKQYRYINEAFSAAYENAASMYDTKKDSCIYDGSRLSGAHRIKDVMRIGQYPELHRGCEITSLCMLFNYKKVNKSKIELAEEIFKDKTPFSVKHGMIHYGNPNIGFVGSIYSKDEKGYGVYHKPIYLLTEKYFGSKALDITGTKPVHLYYFLDKNCPVWVIVNSKFKPLESENFEKWYTSEGEIEITYSEHSVLLTGYDERYVYFNDPMHPENEKSAYRPEFEAAWQQMGAQAVTIEG